MCNIKSAIYEIDVPEDDPIYAVRRWRIQRQHYKRELTPLIQHGFTWKKFEPTKAKPCVYCGKHNQPLISLHCSCGLYALNYYDRGERMDAFLHRETFGAVKMWGHVAVYSLGYRAEYGQPVALTRYMRGMPIFHAWKWRGKLAESRDRAFYMARDAKIPKATYHKDSLRKELLYG